MVVIKPNVNYRLLNLKAGTYVSISTNDNVSIVGQPYADETAQQWSFESAGGDAYFIKSANAEPVYLSIPGNNIAPGQQLMTNTSPFIWEVLNVPNMTPVAKFTPAANGNIFVDLWGANPASGTKVQLWTKTDTAQIWILEEVRN